MLTKLINLDPHSLFKPVRGILGFSLVEVMLAVAIFTSLGLALYLLQITLSMSLQQILVRQDLIPSVINLAQQLSAMDPATAETAYNDNTLAPTVDCARAMESGACSKEDYIKYSIFNWKHKLAQSSVPEVKAIVCFDDEEYASKVPTANSAACSSSGMNLVIKLVWDRPAYPAANPNAANYFVLRVP